MPQPADSSSLTLDVRAGESVRLAGVSGGDVVVEVLAKSGRTARLRVSAPRSVTIEKSTECDGMAGSAAVPCMT
jgi:hypothetical protein